MFQLTRKIYYLDVVQGPIVQYLYIVHRHSTQYSVLRTQYTVLNTQYTVHRLQYSTQYTDIVHKTQYTVHRHSTQYSVNSTQTIVLHTAYRHSTQYTVHRLQYSTQHTDIVLHTAHRHSTQYNVHSTQTIVLFTAYRLQYTKCKCTMLNTQLSLYSLSPTHTFYLTWTNVNLLSLTAEGMLIT